MKAKASRTNLTFGHRAHVYACSINLASLFFGVLTRVLTGHAIIKSSGVAYRPHIPCVEA